jgi:hypothetical protein
MERVLSRLTRKISGIEPDELKYTGWHEARARVFDYLKNDRVLQKLITRFTVIDDQVRLTRSSNNMKIRVHVMENVKGYKYIYASTYFTVNGKRKEFKKYIGKESEVDVENIDLFFLEKYFLDILKNYLEYQD